MTTTLLFIVFSLILFHHSNALKCYVCGEYKNANDTKYNSGGPCFQPTDQTVTEDNCLFCKTNVEVSEKGNEIKRICADDRDKNRNRGDFCFNTIETYNTPYVECHCSADKCKPESNPPFSNWIKCYECTESKVDSDDNEGGPCLTPDDTTTVKEHCIFCRSDSKNGEKGKMITRNCETDLNKYKGDICSISRAGDMDAFVECTCDKERCQPETNAFQYINCYDCIENVDGDGKDNKGGPCLAPNDLDTHPVKTKTVGDCVFCYTEVPIGKNYKEIKRSCGKDLALYKGPHCHDTTIDNKPYRECQCHENECEPEEFKTHRLPGKITPKPPSNSSTSKPTAKTIDTTTLSATEPAPLFMAIVLSALSFTFNKF